MTSVRRKGPGRPPLPYRKALVSLRLDPRALAAWKASGRGWSARMAAALTPDDWPAENRGSITICSTSISLHQGDALELSTQLLASGTQFDAVIADPPYGIGYSSRHNDGRREGRKWAQYLRDKNFAPIHGDDTPFDPAPWLELAAERPLILWGANHYADRLPSARGWLIWDKRAGTGAMSQADCEMAWTNLNQPVRMYSHLWRGLCRGGEENVSVGGPKLHPHQKPVALLDWCLDQTGLQPGDTVLDPYMGSGSLGVACIRRGIHYIGVEIDPVYFEIAQKRLDRERQNAAPFAGA